VTRHPDDIEALECELESLKRCLLATGLVLSALAQRFGLPDDLQIGGAPIYGRLIDSGRRFERPEEHNGKTTNHRID
jgi:hypothetical protein